MPTGRFVVLQCGMITTELQQEGGERIGRLWVAERLRERLRGLLGRETLAPGELLLLERCRMIHTFGMRFAIDVVFLDRAWRVVGLRQAVPAGRIAWGGWRAVRTLEAGTGWLAFDRLRGAQLVPPSTACPPAGPPPWPHGMP